MLFAISGRIFRPGDLLVLNDSRVRPARVWAPKPNGGRLELLILRPTADGDWDVDETRAPCTGWHDVHPH